RDEPDPRRRPGRRGHGPLRARRARRRAAPPPFRADPRHAHAPRARDAGRRALRLTALVALSSRAVSQGELMVRLAHVVTILLVTAALAQAQAPVTTLSLDDAVALALRENPTVRAKQHEYRATQAQEITAGLRPNPTASSLAEQIGSRNDPQYTFSLGQPIELGGKRARRLDSARAASRVTAAELED